MPKCSIYSVVTRGQVVAFSAKKPFDRNSCLRSAKKTHIIDRHKNSIIPPKKVKRLAQPQTPPTRSPKKQISPKTVATVAKSSTRFETLVRNYPLRGKNANATNPVKEITAQPESRDILWVPATRAKIWCVETRSQRSDLKKLWGTNRSEKKAITCSSEKSNKKIDPRAEAFTVTSKESSLMVSSKKITEELLTVKTRAQKLVPRNQNFSPQKFQTPLKKPTNKTRDMKVGVLPQDDMISVQSLQIVEMRSTKLTANKKFNFSQKVSAKKGNSKTKTRLRQNVSLLKVANKITENHRKILIFELDRLNRLDCQVLRKILESNNQNWFGNKLELMLRVAQGRIFGRSPACPVCKQRKFDLDFETETWNCNSTIFLPEKLDYCESIFVLGDLKTAPWVEDGDFATDWESLSFEFDV